MRASALAAALLVSSTAALAACGSDAKTDASSAPATATTAGASCDVASLPLKKAGVLTIGTDKPAYSPYFESDDPTNGKGFESSVAYAIAAKLGFDKTKVKWSVVPFNAAFRPGSKDFDFDVNQVSITAKRQKVVDFSHPYFTAPQAVLALKSSPVANATTLAALKSAKLGVQVGTTSLDAATAAIAPSTAPQVFNDSNDVVSALKIKRVDAVVVDLPTAIYLADAELTNAKVVGQFQASGGDQWGAVLEKGSALTACVDQAVDALTADGTIAKLQKQWITDAEQAPELH